MSFRDRVALVTGADRGIGRVIYFNFDYGVSAGQPAVRENLPRIAIQNASARMKLETGPI